jgi:SNF2 family DNA or RNA helicase
MVTRSKGIVPAHNHSNRLDDVTNYVYADGTSSIIFSQWSSMLDMLEKALSMRGIEYGRIDGKKSLRQRREVLRSFEQEPSWTVLLATLGTAGVG